MSLPQDPKDALAALERLVNRHRLLDVEEARKAARIITNDPNFEFPPPRQPPAGEGGEAQPPREPSAKEAPAKEVPAKEVPAKEVPAKEVPAKEVPAKEASAAAPSPSSNGSDGDGEKGGEGGAS